MDIVQPLSATHLKVGQKVRSLRSKMELTQEELAFRVGVDRSYMGFVERGEKNPTLMTLMKIAHALKIPLKDLLD